MRNVLLSYFILVTFFTIAQSPWVKDKGQGYTQLSLATIPTYQRVFQGNQKQLNHLNGRIGEYSVQTYTEMGIGKRFQINLSLPLRYVHSKDINSSITARQEGQLFGVGNTEVSIKHNLINRSMLLSWQATLNLPSTKSKENAGLRVGYPVFSFVPLLIIGYGNSKNYMYAYSGLGFFTDRYKNDIRFGGEYGHSFLNGKLWGVLALHARETINSTLLQEQYFDETFLFVDNQSYTSFSSKLIYKINDSFGLNFSTNLISVRAKNLPFQRPFSIGLSYEW